MHFRKLVPHADYSDIADATHMVVGDQNDAFGDRDPRFPRAHAWERDRGMSQRAAKNGPRTAACDACSLRRSTNGSG
jgi:hypothetical protein